MPSLSASSTGCGIPARGAASSSRQWTAHHSGHRVATKRNNSRFGVILLACMEDMSALKLLLTPGEYRLSLDIPGIEGQTSGDVEFLPDQPPRGALYDNVPLTVEGGPNDTMIGFPQTHHYDVLHGSLASGHTITLLEATVESWFPGRAFLYSRAILVGLPGSGEPTAFEGLEIQVSGMDVVAGIAPLKSMSLPNSEPGGKYLDVTWTVEGQPDSTQEWSDADATLSWEFVGGATIGDPYYYRLHFSPMSRVTTQSPISFDEILEKWVTPIQRIVSLATGRAEKVTALTMLTAATSIAHQRHQVFGFGVTQEPYSSRLEDQRRVSAAIRAKADRVSILDLVRRWQELEEEQHPLLTTYGNFLVSDSEHPRSRFLLLIQALEGLHGYEHQQEWSQTVAKHKAQRVAAIADLKASNEVSAETLSFVKKSIGSRPMASLETALQWAVDTLPVDLTPRLDALHLTATVKTDDSNVTTWKEALRKVRNDLAHGNRPYKPGELRSAVTLLEAMARAHMLRVLGCSGQLQKRALQTN